MTRLDALQKHTIVVADTGDLDAIGRLRPRDATTNPSLLLKAASDDRYQEVFEASVRAVQDVPAERRLEAFMDDVAVAFGCRILDLIPGRVSTEVDASLSFDRAGTVARARRIISLYEARGVGRDRVLVKIGSTWEGIQAARELEADGIHCNLTLLFSFAQAVACAEAGVTLISPFVGRIYDWYRKERGVETIAAEEDPGVLSVRRIYNYFKKFGYTTEVMGASFRSIEQIVALCGCDLLTIAPDLIESLGSGDGDVPPQLTVEGAAASTEERIHLDEKGFRWLHNTDAMAVEKLSDGIRRFDADARKLEALARKLL